MIPNLYLQRIHDDGLLSKDGGFAIDVGCGNGRDSEFLSSLGYVVTSVDVEDKGFPNVVISDIRDFYIEKNKYSFITCNNVLPFLSDQAEVVDTINKLFEGLRKEGVMYFTIFGKNCDIKVPTHFEYQEIGSFLEKLPVEIIETSTREGYGKNMRGERIHAHVHTFIVKRK